MDDGQFIKSALVKFIRIAYTMPHNPQASYFYVDGTVACQRRLGRTAGLRAALMFTVFAIHSSNDSGFESIVKCLKNRKRMHVVVWWHEVYTPASDHHTHY